MNNMTLGEQLRAKLAARELNQWAKDDEAHKKMEERAHPTTPLFQITNNLSRATFDQIKNNPDIRSRVTQAMVKQGYKYNSASAIIGHMLLQGVVQPDNEGVLHTTIPEYVPLKSAKTLKNKNKKIVVDVRRKTVRVEVERVKRPVSSSSAGLAALVPKVEEKQVPRVDALLRSLSVLEARELYDALRSIFGDNK